MNVCVDVPARTPLRLYRVGVLIILLGLLNVYDLNMTIKAIDHGVMFEANPIADLVIVNHGCAGLSLFKGTFIGLSLIAFMIGRKTALSEFGLLASVTIYVGVAALWYYYPMDSLIEESNGMAFLSEQRTFVRTD